MTIQAPAPSLPPAPPSTSPPEAPNRGWAAESLLTVVLACLILIPGRLVIGPLGAAGRPGELLAMACLLWWVNAAVVRGVVSDGRRRTGRLVIGSFSFCILISYVVAMTRPIDSVEVRAADRGLLHTAAWAGLWLLASEGLASRERLETLLRRMVILGTVMALVGIVQFTTGYDPTASISLPGFTSNGDVTLLTRNGLYRPQGTATHPIEFGVVMAMLVPLALHQMFHPAKNAVFWPRVRVAVIALAAVMSVSRSAVLGLTVGALMLVPHWPARRRKQALITAVVFLVLVKIAAPRLISTLIGLFTGIGSDDSAASRTNALASVSQFIEARPIFGRGLATFLPSYVILDNQFLGTLIELGAVGLLALIIVLLTGVVVAWRGALATEDDPGRSLGWSLSAAAAIPATSFATFDALGFSDTATLTFFMGGCCLAYARIEGRTRGRALAAARAAAFPAN